VPERLQIEKDLCRCPLNDDEAESGPLPFDGAEAKKEKA
jgi:hypothetical protein